MKRQIVAVMGFLCLSASAQDAAQKLNDSIHAVIASKFPRMRTIDVQYRYLLPSDFDSELHKRDYAKGRMVDHEQWKAAVNLPIYARQKWNVLTTLDYRYERFGLEDLELLSDAVGPFDDNPAYHYFGASVSAMYYGSLFKKVVIYTASLTADGSHKDIERLKGTLGATILLKRTSRTVIGLGLVLLVDPAAPVPVAPVFSIDHKFRNSLWALDFILPQRLLLKRPVFSHNARISVGAEFSADGFYMYSDSDAYADVYDFRQLELKSGITYEHCIGKGTILYAKAGVSNLLGMRLTERGENTSDYILSAKRDATGYFTLGASYNLQKPKKK